MTAGHLIADLELAFATDIYFNAFNHAAVGIFHLFEVHHRFGAQRFDRVELDFEAVDNIGDCLFKFALFHIPRVILGGEFLNCAACDFAVGADEYSGIVGRRYVENRERQLLTEHDIAESFSKVFHDFAVSLAVAVFNLLGLAALF